MMQRDDGGDLLLDLEDAVTQTLVVVHEVVLAEPLLEVLVDAHAEGQRFAEGSLEVCEHLGEIALRLDLPVAGEPTGVLVVPDVEAGEFGE